MRPFRGTGPELFLPIGTAGPVLRQLMNAKRVCARCPVGRECSGGHRVGAEPHNEFGSRPGQEAGDDSDGCFPA